MMPRLILLLLFFVACSAPSLEVEKKVPKKEDVVSAPDLDLAQAERLIKLPINCIGNPLPYKAGHTIAKEEDLSMPQVHHPAFYGCFDWHSAVHGHWSAVYLLKSFPNISSAKEARALLDKNLTAENIQTELAYFSMNKYTASFERTYGWAWLLKLSEELYTWDDKDAKRWHKNLAPLCDYIKDKYIEYLPKLVYPIRVGEHSNTAFGLGFAYDYALIEGKKDLQKMIEDRARSFYASDKNCPIGWEPSGYDFLSPCLEEMDIMRRVLKPEEFTEWLYAFLPAIKQNTFDLAPGEIIDRSDGKLVHLDGLNLSRAWCLYGACQQIADSDQLRSVADKHLSFSLSKITDGDYAGEHWLGSFALYALKSKSEL